jgi:DNA-binding Lrp family transcriptional regulator
MRTLDAVDRQILEILQKDGRITMTDLAVQIGRLIEFATP